MSRQLRLEKKGSWVTFPFLMHDGVRRGFINKERNCRTKAEFGRKTEFHFLSIEEKRSISQF